MNDGLISQAAMVLLTAHPVNALRFQRFIWNFKAGYFLADTLEYLAYLYTVLVEPIFEVEIEYVSMGQNIV